MSAVTIPSLSLNSSPILPYSESFPGFNDRNNVTEELLCSSEDSENIGGRLRSLIQELERSLGYTRAKSGGTDFKGLMQGMREQADRMGIAYPEGSHAYRAFEFGAHFAYFCYPKHPIEIRIYTGIYTWLTVLIDDNAGKDPQKWLDFMPHFHMGEQQSCPISRAWARHLNLSYKYYSKPVASFIITSSLNFVNATVLEDSISKIKRTAGGENWPYYLREKDGVGEAYVWLTFPTDIYPDLWMCIEAVSDMNKFLCFTNDILSFYKEVKAGEKSNYAHNRALYEGKSVYTILKDMVKEDVDAYQRIATVLEGREPYAQAWHAHAMGFVAFHKFNERYKLDELGLGEGGLN